MSDDDNLLYTYCRGPYLTAHRIDSSTNQLIPASSPCAIRLPELVTWFDTFRIVAVVWFCLLFVLMTVQTVRKTLVVMQEEKRFWRNFGWQLYFRLNIALFLFLFIVADPLNAYNTYNMDGYLALVFTFGWLILSHKFSIAGSWQRSFLAMKGYPEHKTERILWFVQLVVLVVAVFSAIPLSITTVIDFQRLIVGILCILGSLSNAVFGTWMFFEYQRNSAGLSSRNKGSVDKVMRRLMFHSIVTFFLSTIIALGYFLTLFDWSEERINGEPAYTMKGIKAQILFNPGVSYLGGTVYVPAFLLTWKVRSRAAASESNQVKTPRHQLKSSSA